MLNQQQTFKDWRYGLETNTLAAMNSWTSAPSGFGSSGSDLSRDLGVSGDLSGGADAVETYFECISTCSLDDAECITVCTAVLRDSN